MTKDQSFSSSLQLCHPQLSIVVTKKKKIRNKVSKQVRDGRIQNRRNVRKHFTAIWKELLRKLLLLRKKKQIYFGQCALNGEYNRSKLKKKTYLLSGAYHYSTETYSRIRNFGNNHTLKQWALKKKKKIHLPQPRWHLRWGYYVERDERNRFVLSKNDIII